MKVEPKIYNSVLEDNIKRRFNNISSVKVREIKDGFSSDFAIDWAYLGVEHTSNFYINGEKRLNFFIELEFEGKNGLKKLIEENSKSGNEIDKSNFLSRPHREYIKGSDIVKGLESGDYDKSHFRDYIKGLLDNKKINPDRDYYFICCKIKKIPENPNNLINAVWGYLIAPPVSSLMGF